jgi:hypothetical protein
MSAQFETFTTKLGITPFRAPASPAQLVLGKVSERAVEAPSD